MELGFQWNADARTFEALRASFRWNMPDDCNIAAWACDRWADGDRTALIEWTGDGLRETSFRALHEAACRFANVLGDTGLRPGDRVAVLLPQCPETAIAHLACYRAGLVAVPLALLFGPEALLFRLGFCKARAIVTCAQGQATLSAVKDDLPDLAHVFDVDDGFAELLHGTSTTHERVATTPDTPALMIYTSGTTGPPKGALHGHRVVVGHLPGILTLHDLRLGPNMGEPDDRCWTPADWAWAGGLLNVLLTALATGTPVVFSRDVKFDPARAYRLMAEAGVRNAFIPPTALRMMRGVEPKAKPRLRTLITGGETLGEATYAWGRDTLGVTIHEGYGQTECNIVTASCSRPPSTRAGSMGRATPGHDTDILRVDGSRAAEGETGEVAVRAPHPVQFLEYLDQPDATAAKYREVDKGRWLLTGDQGRRDADGFLFFVGRDDDVITSAGFRIGPGEIEDCLIRHPAVRLAAVVGKPDALRTEIVKAWVVLEDGRAGDDALRADITTWVRERLSAHEYPREIAFVDALPLTTTGKVIRRELRARG